MKKSFISIIILLSLLVFSACTSTPENTPSETSSDARSAVSKSEAVFDKTEESSDDEIDFDSLPCAYYSDLVEKGYIKDGTYRVTLEQIKEFIDKYHNGAKVYEEVQKIQPRSDYYKDSEIISIIRISYKIDDDTRVDFCGDGRGAYDILLCTKGKKVEKLWSDNETEKTVDESTLVSYTEEESMMISSFNEEQQKHIQTLSDEERSELFDLLSKQSRYPYRISVLIGETDPEQPKLTLEKIKEIVNNAMSDPRLDTKIKRYNYIIEEVDRIQEFCDFVPVGESTPTKWYFLDGDRYDNVQNVIEIYGSDILHRVLENGDFIIKEVLYDESVKASENS